MIRFLVCILVYQVVSCQPFGVNPVAPYARAINPAIPPIGPYPRPYQLPGAPGVPLAPGRNPYYNSAVVAPEVPIVAYSNEVPVDGTYAFSFATADGKQAQENGFLKDAYIDNTGEPQGTQVVQGSYSYISPEGTPIAVSYVADENGFRPSGIHIPADGKGVLPPIVPPIVPPVGPVVPTVLDGLRNDPRRVLDPAYRYDPYNYRNNYLGPHSPGAYHPSRYEGAGYNHPTRYTAYNGRYNPGYNTGYNTGYNPGYNAGLGRFDGYNHHGRYDSGGYHYDPQNTYRPSWNNKETGWNNKETKEEQKKA